MDIGIDTIIYIVLGLVFVLAQISRKKRAVKESRATEAKSTKVVEDQQVSALWDEFWNSSDPSPNRDSVLETVVPQEIDDTLSFPFKKDVKPMNDERVIENSERRPDWKSMDLEEPQSESDDDEGSFFNLRSAVIYSVLLDRKEF